MLRDIAQLLTGAFGARAPKAFRRGMSPLHTRPSQVQNMDVELVSGAISSAQAGDITPLLSLYRDIEAADTTIQSAISTRKLAVLARGYNVVADKGAGEAGQKVADQVKAMLDRSESFVDACTWLLHGCVWPVSVIERRWVPGALGFSHPDFRVVPLELLDYTTRALRIRCVGPHGEVSTETHSPGDARYLVHRGHMIMAPDTWGGPMRALVFWFLFSTQDREWWARFLERFGAPFLVGRYDKNDDESRLVLEQAFQEATRLFGVVATRETEIEIKETGNASTSSQAFQAFHECAKNEKLLLILGQTLSGNAESTGLGSGVAGLQGRVRDDVRLWDAFKLAQTIRAAVIKPWMQLNGITGPVPQLVFGGFDPAQMAGMGEFLAKLSTSGLELTDDSVDEVSRHMGLGLQRKAAPSGGFVSPALALAASGLPPVTVANEAVARAGAAELSRAFSGDLSPLAEIVASSRSRAELLQRASAFLAGYRGHQSQRILEDALAAHAGNAAVRAA